jgi:hypothetical protein
MEVKRGRQELSIFRVCNGKHVIPERNKRKIDELEGQQVWGGLREEDANLFIKLFFSTSQDSQIFTKPLTL